MGVPEYNKWREEYDKGKRMPILPWSEMVKMEQEKVLGPEPAAPTEEEKNSIRKMILERLGGR